MIQKWHQNRHPLATAVQYVKGVGPALAERLGKMGILTVGDLLAVTPIRYLDRRHILAISELAPGKDRTIVGDVIRAGIAFMGKRRKRIFEVVISDGTGKVSLKFFNFHQKFFEKKFKVGTKLIVSGEASQFINTLQFIHPETEPITDDDDSNPLGKIVPVYPLTEGLYQRTMRKIVRNAWDKYNEHIHPIFPQAFAEKHNLSDPWSCLQEMHFPSPDLDPELLTIGRSAAHRTLIFDEFFFLELGLALRRRNHVVKAGIAFPENAAVHDKFIRSLPFELTGAQKRVISEIFDDMGKPHPMNRLLQGDVGSGKTVVALAAAARAIAAGYQAAIMAPTEILAEQHFQTIEKLKGAVDFPFGLLTSSVKAQERGEVLSRLKSGEMALIVGTHALIQEGVEFNRLGFIVVDEQHRFGVMQRAAIRQKGAPDHKAMDPGWPDILIMTATPIPRTLAMTLYGDLDVSVIDELPRGRKPIITRLYEEHKREKLYDGMRHELRLGKQVYIVYPLIEESEKVDLKNATDMSREIARAFEPEFRVALLHGRMKGDEKESIMGDFKAGRIHILVATSVVEVGVDVPNASVMVIEHAERFGLSQLHQLRGRVGRSDHQSYCILMADYRRSEDARRRLGVMVETTDGFKIAEEDLSLRGPGDFLGTRQSGLPPFRIANIARDVGILGQARKAAFELIETDPHIARTEHERIREVLFARWEGRLSLADIS